MGKHKLKLKAYGYKTIKRTIDLNQPHKVYNYTLKEQKEYYWQDKDYIKLKFIELGVNVNPVPNNTILGLEVGYYIKGLHFGCYFGYGLSDSEPVSFIDPGINDSQIVTKELDSYIFAVKLGYAFGLARRVIILPLVTLGEMTLSWDLTEDEAANYVHTEDIGDKVFTCSGGIRLSFALVKGLELNITPSYHYAGSGYGIYSETCKQLPYLHKWNNGFKVKYGLSIYF